MLHLNTFGCLGWEGNWLGEGGLKIQLFNPVTVMSYFNDTFLENKSTPHFYLQIKQPLTRLLCEAIAGIFCCHNL